MNLLIDDWKRAYKLLTVQLGVLLTILGNAWEYLPMLQQYLDASVLKYVGPVVVLVRLIKQAKAAPTATAADVPVDPA